MTNSPVSNPTDPFKLVTNSNFHSGHPVIFRTKFTHQPISFSSMAPPLLQWLIPLNSSNKINSCINIRTFIGLL